MTTAYGGTAPPAAYTYVAGPTISNLTPANLPLSGGLITITGTNFTGASLTIDGDSVTPTINTAHPDHRHRPASCRRPRGRGGDHHRGAGQPPASPTWRPPTITNLSPTNGPLSGTSVIITGGNFVGLSGAAAVTFGGVNATSYTVDLPTQITAVAPAKAIAGTVRVQVTAAGGSTSDTAADNFTYVAVPTITSLDPTSGLTAGGNTVTITGTDLTTASAVTFGGTSATFFVNSPDPDHRYGPGAHRGNRAGAGDDRGRADGQHQRRRLHI